MMRCGRGSKSSIGPSASPSVSPSASLSPSVSASISPSQSPSISSSVSPSASLSPSISPSVSASVSPSASLSPSRSPSISPSQSPSASLSPSISPSISPSVSPSASLSPSRSPSLSASLSPSISPSVSPSISPSISPSTSSGAAPTFVAQYATTFNASSTPRSAMSGVAINSSDVLVGIVVGENATTWPLALTENGGASWVTQQSYSTTDYTAALVSSYVAPANETITVTATQADGSLFGANVIRFSGSGGIGASNKAQGSSGSPSVSLTTTQANSAIVVVCGDWNAVSGTQTFTNNFSGTPTALTDYPGDGAAYGVAIAYFSDAGAAGSKTVGMSAPTGQKWSIIAIEVKGT